MSEEDRDESQQTEEFNLDRDQTPVLELIAVGPEPKQRWRRQIRSGQLIILGRAPRNGWAVPWDRNISREHAELVLHGRDQVKVRRLEVARSCISFNGDSSNEFTLSVGESFRVGVTTFYLANVEVRAAERNHVPIEEQSFRPGELGPFTDLNAGHRLKILSELPRVVSEVSNNEELANGLVDILLRAIPHAAAAAVLQYPPEIDKIDPADPIMLRWESRDASQFTSAGDHGGIRPSRRLIMQALEGGGPVLHVWSDREDEDSSYTSSDNFDWAFCTPITAVSCRGWCLYVSGQIGMDVAPSSRIVSGDDLRSDVQFTEMLSEFVGAIRRVPLLQPEQAGLEQEQAGLAQFFCPPEVEMLRARDEQFGVDTIPTIEVSATDVMGSHVSSSKSMRALEPRGDYRKTRSALRDPVDCTVFAPPSTSPGSRIMVQVFLHQPEAKDEVRQEAIEFDPDAKRRGVTSLSTRICRGAFLTLRLELPGAAINLPTRDVVWHGRPFATQFSVQIPAGTPLGRLHGTLHVAQNAVPIGEVTFQLLIEADANESRLEPTGQATRYTEAFVSYCRTDIYLVSLFAEMLREVGIRFYQDVFTVRPGDNWAPALFSAIDRSDVMFLFWSTAARESSWVEREWKYALKNKGDRFIRPFVIEGPPIPEPPPELSHLHFGHPMQHFIQVPLWRRFLLRMKTLARSWKTAEP